MNLRKRETKYLRPIAVGGIAFIENVLFQSLIVEDHNYNPPQKRCLWVKVPSVDSVKDIEQRTEVEYLLPTSDIENESFINNKHPE